MGDVTEWEAVWTGGNVDEIRPVLDRMAVDTGGYVAAYVSGVMQDLTIVFDHGEIGVGRGQHFMWDGQALRVCGGVGHHVCPESYRRPRFPWGD